jgi:hypothetical protein
MGSRRVRSIRPHWHCSEAVPQSLTHFACVCPKFREARTISLNQVRNVITSFLSTHVGPTWKMYEEIRWPRQVLSPTDRSAKEQIGRRQPDWLLYQANLKSESPFLTSAVPPMSPLLSCKQLVAAAAPQTASIQPHGRGPQLLHRARYTSDPAHVEFLPKFIGIQRKHWKVAAEQSVLASARAIHYLHMRFGELSNAATRSDLNSDNSDCEQKDSKDGAVAKRWKPPYESNPRQQRLGYIGRLQSRTQVTTKVLTEGVEPCPLGRRTPGLLGTNFQAQALIPRDVLPAQV